MRILEGAEASRAEKFLKTAAAVGLEKARCIKSKRGVIIVRGDTEIIGRGYNTPPANEEGCNHCMRQYFRKTVSTTEPCRAIHAEQMAILDALKNVNDLEGTMMYYAKNKNGVFVPSGVPSCTICSKLIAELGISFIMKNSEGIVEYSPEQFNRLSLEYAWKQLNKKSD